MNISNNAIIIAPSILHLALYEKILNEKNNCMNIQVMSLNTFIQSFQTVQHQEELSILYQYKEQLKSIPSSNAYHTSIQDLTFLKSCLSFMKWIKLYNIQLEELPEDTLKERDLKWIVQTLSPIHINEDDSNQVISKMESLDHVYILKKPFSTVESFWIETLLQKGAHFIEEEVENKSFYYSCANTRKEAQILANIIIDNDYDAQNISVFTNDEAENQALAQMFDLYNIPYTFLTRPVHSSVVAEWYHILKWVENPCLDTFKELIQYAYPESNMVNEYFEAFPENFDSNSYHIQNLSYEQNNLMDSVQFAYLKELEAYTIHWMNEHSYIFDWNIHSFEDIAKEVQSFHENVQLEDLELFNEINKLYVQAKPYLSSKEDLSIFIQNIEHLSASVKTSEIKGVLIDSIQNLNNIRPQMFIMGAHSKNFPVLSLETGIFNEEYVRKTKLPSLQKRLEDQISNLKDIVLHSQLLTVLVPQSNYDGKNYDFSNDLEAWLQQKPMYLTIQDPSIYEKMSLTISKDSAQKLFFKKNELSVSRLETFAKCPFEHFLKYGLSLREERSWTDVATRGTILHSILERTTELYEKDYVQLPKSTIQRFVEDEFIFISKVYPNKQKWIQSQIIEYTEHVYQVFEQLKYFEENWSMRITQREYQFHKEFKYDDMTMTFTGFVDRIDEHKNTFCIFDYKSGKRDLKVEKYQAGLSLQLLTYTLCYQDETGKVPFGCFYITLSSPYVQDVAYSLNRKTLTESTLNRFNDFQQQQLMNGWSFADVDLYLNESKQMKAEKKALSVKEIRDQWEVIITGILTNMKEGNIGSNHVKDACTYCLYRRICRNNRTEVEPTSYIEEVA